MPDALQAAGAEVITSPIDFAPHDREPRAHYRTNRRPDHPIAEKLVKALARASVPA